MYDKNIKNLPVGDRLRLARLILDDAAPDEPMATGDAEARYAALIDEGYDSGPATAWTPEDVDSIKQQVIARAASRRTMPHA